MIVRELATGTQTYTENIVKQFTADDVEVIVAYSGEKPRGIRARLERLDSLIPRSLDARHISQILRFLPALVTMGRCVKKFKPHAILTQGLDEIGFLAAVSAYLFNRPAVIYVHDLTLEELRLHSRNRSALPFLLSLSTLRQKLSVRGLSTILVGSNFMKDSLTKMFGVTPKVTRLGVQPEFRGNRGNPPDMPFRIIFIGNLDRKKMPDVPLRAVAQLSELDVRLTYVGDGPERDALIRLREELNQTKRVSFIGRIKMSDLLDELRRSHLCVMPSIWEGFGLAAVEAMASGVPVIGSDSGALRETIKHGHNGYLVPVGDYRTIASYVKKLYQDRSLLKQLSENCSDLNENLDWRSTARQTIEMIKKSVLDSRADVNARRERSGQKPSKHMSKSEKWLGGREG